MASEESLHGITAEEDAKDSAMVVVNQRKELMQMLRISIATSPRIPTSIKRKGFRSKTPSKARSMASTSR